MNREREELLAELAAIEAAPHDGGLGDTLRAKLVEQIEHKLDRLSEPGGITDPGSPFMQAMSNGW